MGHTFWSDRAACHGMSPPNVDREAMSIAIARAARSVARTERRNLLRIGNRGYPARRVEPPQPSYCPRVPSTTFTHRATAPTSADQVWETLQSAETWANIGPVEDVNDAVHHDDGTLSSFRWHTSVASKRYPGVAVVAAAEPKQRMLLELDAREVVGSLEALLEPNGDGTTIITINLTVTSRGTLSTLFFPVVSEAIAKGLPRQVEEFARSLD